MIGGLPGNSFVLMEFEEGGSVFEVVVLALAAVGLDFAELVERFLKLAGDALRLDAEVVEEPMGVDDVEIDCRLLRRWVGGTRQEVGFKERDAVETPGGVDELLDELSFGFSGRLVFVYELAAMVFISDPIFGGEDGGGGG
jgi:hypothetical protein